MENGNFGHFEGANRAVKAGRDFCRFSGKFAGFAGFGKIPAIPAFPAEMESLIVSSKDISVMPTVKNSGYGHVIQHTALENTIGDITKMKKLSLL